MNESYPYKANLSFLLSFFFYLLFSFIIGFISISIGYYYPVYFNELQLALLALLPLVLFIIISFIPWKIPYLYFISPLSWILAIFLPIILLKYIFVILGIIFSLLAMVDLLQHVNRQTINVKMFVLSLFLTDQFIKATNQGQYPISNISLISMIIVIIVGVIFLVFSYDFMTIENSLKDPEKHNQNSYAWSSIPLYFSTFLFIFVFSNNGIVSYGNNLDLNISIMITVLVTVLVSILYLLGKDVLLPNFKEGYIGVVASFLLVISLYYYPWFSISSIFWILGIVCLVAIVQFSLNSFSFKSKNSLVLFISASYFLMVLLLVIILLTELYIIFAGMALIALLAIIIKFFSKSYEESETSIKVPEKLILLKVWEFLHVRNRVHKYGIVVILTLIITLSTSTPIFVTVEKPNFPTTGISVLAYNLHFGQDNNGFDNIDEVVKYVTSDVAPNFVSFEEVMFNGPINGYSNMFGRLKNLLGPVGYKYSYHTTGTPTFLTNAFFSMFPIVNASTIDLLPKDQFYRTALNIVIEIAPNKYLRVLPVHLTSVIEDASNPDRVSQGNLILDTIASLHSSIPAVILGDFNSFPEWPETTIFSTQYQDAWNKTHPGESGYTWPTYGPPNQRIDYIFVDNSISISSCSISDNLSISDHNAIYCNLNY